MQLADDGCDPQRECAGHRHRNNNDDDGVPQSVDKFGVIEHLDVVAKAHKGFFAATQHGIEETGIDTADHGDDDKQHEEEQERQQKQVGSGCFPDHQLTASFIQCYSFVSQGNPPLNIKVISNSE